MWLIQLLLPICDNKGRPFPNKHYQRVRQDLTAKFNGLTVFSRAPAEGLWKEKGMSVERDDIVIFEIMAEQCDHAWWSDYKASLERLFAQDEIIVRAQETILIK